MECTDYPKEFLGEWSQNPCKLQGKSPLYWRLRGGSNSRHRITQDSEPNTLPTELLRPVKLSEIQILSFCNSRDTQQVFILFSRLFPVLFLCLISYWLFISYIWVGFSSAVFIKSKSLRFGFCFWVLGCFWGRGLGVAFSCFVLFLFFCVCVLVFVLFLGGGGGGISGTDC